MGNTCIPVMDSCWCMAKPIQYCKVINLQLNKFIFKKKNQSSRMRQKGMNCSMTRDECFRLGRVIIYVQMCISNALEAELSKYSISLKKKKEVWWTELIRESEKERKSEEVDLRYWFWSIILLYIDMILKWEEGRWKWLVWVFITH